MSDATDRPTLADVTERYVADRAGRGEVGPDSARQFRVRLAGLVAACPPGQAVADLDPDAIRRWQHSIGHLKPATRRGYLATVRTFCRWAVAMGFMSADPTVDLAPVREPRRTPRALSADQVARLFAAAGTDVRMQTMLALMVGMGLRCIEVAGLAISDYDAGARTLFVRGKFDNERVLPVPPEVATALERYLTVVGHEAGPLVRTLKGDRGIGAAQVSRLVSVLFATAGVKESPKDGRSAHALRHTCASDVLDHSRDLRVVQELLGHVRLSSTEIYLRGAGLDRMREAMAGRIDKFLPGCEELIDPGADSPRTSRAGCPGSSPTRSVRAKSGEPSLQPPEPGPGPDRSEQPEPPTLGAYLDAGGDFAGIACVELLDEIVECYRGRVPHAPMERTYRLALEVGDRPYATFLRWQGELMAGSDELVARYLRARAS